MILKFPTCDAASLSQLNNTHSTYATYSMGLQHMARGSRYIMQPTATFVNYVPAIKVTHKI
jgi:hypothetical protein